MPDQRDSYLSEVRRKLLRGRSTGALEPDTVPTILDYGPEGPPGGIHGGAVLEGATPPAAPEREQEHALMAAVARTTHNPRESDDTPPGNPERKVIPKGKPKPGSVADLMRQLDEHSDMLLGITQIVTGMTTRQDQQDATVKSTENWVHQVVGDQINGENWRFYRWGAIVAGGVCGGFIAGGAFVFMVLRLAGYVV